MEIIKGALLALHFLGLARLIGGSLTQVSNTKKTINQSMFDGTLTQLVTGFALYGLNMKTANHMVVGIKIIVLVVIMALVFMNRKKPEISDSIYWGIAGGAILNVLIAVFGGVLRET